MNRSLALLLTLPLLVGACSSNIGAYSVSADNVVTARSLARSSPHRVGSVTSSSAKPQNWISCRALAVGFAGQQTFHSYIAKALKDELALGELVDPKGDIALEVHLAKLGFSSHYGTWEIVADVSANGKPLLQAIGSHERDISFDAVQECNNASSNFEFAVQNLIRDIVAHPDFNALFAG